MADAARAAAAALDTGAAEQARNAFDQRVRASTALQAVKEQMRSLRPDPQAFVAALTATAAAFEDSADIVARTRNRILDIVAAATDRIDEIVTPVPPLGGEDDHTALPAGIETIVSQARAEVGDVVRGALSAIGSVSLPTLDIVSDTSGQPRPTVGSETASRGHFPATDGPLSVIGPSHEVTHHRGPRESPAPVAVRTVESGYELRDREIPQVPPERTVVGRPTETVPGGTAPGFVAHPPSASASETLDRSTDLGTVTADSGTVSTTRNIGITAPANEPRETVGSMESAAVEHDTSASTETRDNITSAVPIVGTASGAVPGVAANTTGVVPIMAAVSRMPQAGPASAPEGAAVSSAGPAGRPGRLPISVADLRVLPPDAKVAGPSGVTDVHGSGGRGPQAKIAPAQRDLSTAEGKGVDLDEPLRGSVVAAGVDTANPSFVVGERVDGDLQVACTLLANVLTVSTSVAPWLCWAVGILRHPGGIAAYVTSNEGRGWLPAGLFLPRVVSTPWVWSFTDDGVWETVADPARVSAEFGLAWGQKFGGGLSALACSSPIDSRLQAQLSGVSMASAVPPSHSLELAEPHPELRDRLGLVGSRPLQKSAAAVAPEAIGVRRLELALDAHIRLGKITAAEPPPLDSAALRKRILRAKQLEVAVPQEWWVELRDMNDLLAASMISYQIDVSAVPLGELRSESAGRSRSEESSVRNLVFERRCNELVLLTANRPDQQSMRDAVYTHAQVIGHPVFVAESESASGLDRPRPRRVISARGDR